MSTQRDEAAMTDSDFPAVRLPAVQDETQAALSQAPDEIKQRIEQAGMCLPLRDDGIEQPGTWLSLRDAGFSAYESADDGYGPDQRPVRSVDRTVGARRIKGVALKTKVGTHGYLEVKLYNDQGRQETRTVHSLVLFPRVGPCPPGQQTRHYDDDPFNNRWRPGGEAASVAAGGNLFYGTQPEQEEDKYRNGRPRPAPRPERHCVRCQAILKTNGKNCHDCVVKLGRDAAPMLRRRGADPADVAAALDYPSADGIVKLAVVYGGYGQPRLKRWLHRILSWGR